MNINSLRSFKNSVPQKMKRTAKIVAYTSLAVASFAVAMPKAFNEVKKMNSKDLFMPSNTIKAPQDFDSVQAKKFTSIIPASIRQLLAK